METIKEFKEVLQIIFNDALEHYNGNKNKANEAVERYCQGLNEGERKKYQH